MYGEYCSDRILDAQEDMGGKPFSGLTYELYGNGNLMYYCFYKDRFEDGEYIEFYENGNLENKQNMSLGRITGREEIWFQNGELKSVDEYELGICLNLKEWDIDGNLIKGKINS